MGIRSYRTNNVETAPPEQILILLLEKLVYRLEQLEKAIPAKDWTTVQTEAKQSRLIFLELIGALDHSVAPEISSNLQALYTWCIHHLTDAVREADLQRLSKVKSVVVHLHQTWTQAVRKAQAQPAPERAA